MKPYSIQNKRDNRYGRNMKTTDPKNIALQFNNCITNADINGLADLMAEDHVFIDTANNRIEGKTNNLTKAWEPFFAIYPGYRNIFEKIIVRGSKVFMLGYSVCPEEILNNVYCIWVAEVVDSKVSLWHIYADTEENRENLNLCLKYYYGRVPACGVFCGGCPMYLRKKKPCPGAEINSARCENCKSFHLCCKEREITHCYQCKSFPCYRFKRFAKSWEKYGQNFIENQRMLKEAGAESFLAYFNSRLG